MVANILRSIFFLLLTAVLQYASIWFHAVPTAEPEVPHILFSYVLPALLLAIACCQWRKISAFKRRAWMAENPA